MIVTFIICCLHSLVLKKDFTGCSVSASKGRRCKATCQSSMTPVLRCNAQD
jgi:hypothetical protein